MEWAGTSSFADHSSFPVFASKARKRRSMSPQNTRSPAVTSAEPFPVRGRHVEPIPLINAHFDVFGVRIDDDAYCTDLNKVPEAGWPLP